LVVQVLLLQYQELELEHHLLVELLPLVLVVFPLQVLVELLPLVLVVVLVRLCIY
jgi:hypothetical protein